MRFLFVLDRVENPASANALLGRELAAALRSQGHEIHLLELTDGLHAPPPVTDVPLYQLPFADERKMNEALENGRRDDTGSPILLRLMRLCAHPTAVAASFRQLVLKKPRRTAAAKREMERLDAEFHYDAVLCVCAPYRTAFALETAQISGKKLLWQLDPYAANRDYKAPGGYEREGKLLDALDAAFVTPTATADYLPGGELHAWQGKVHTLGFPALIPPKNRKKTAKNAENFSNSCVFCGSLYPKLREPDFALRLFAALGKDAPPLVMAGGGWQPFEERTAPLAAQLGDKLTRPGLLTPEQAAALQQNAAILLSLGNATDNQLPSKLFGYFATGKPILHLAVTASDPALPYLARYPLALVVQQSEALDDAALESVKTWLADTCGKRIPFEQVAALYPEFAPGQVTEEFLRGCGW